MNFPSYVKNKMTRFSCTHGDDTCEIYYDYDPDGIEEFVRAFETIAKFLGYSEDTLREYYRNLDLANASHDPLLVSDNDD